MLRYKFKGRNTLTLTAKIEQVPVNQTTLKGYYKSDFQVRYDCHEIFVVFLLNSLVIQSKY